LTTKKFFLFLAIGAQIFNTSWYSISTFKGLIQPTIITWLMFGLATSLSFWTYWASGKHTWKSNIANFLDVISVFIAILVIIFLGHNIRFNVNPFEIVCIILCLIILVFWRITKSHEKSNILLQVIMMLAYIPTYYQLWNASESTEPLITWLMNWIMSLSSLILAIKNKDKLAIIYPGRALVMLSIMIFLILRLKL